MRKVSAASVLVLVGTLALAGCANNPYASVMVVALGAFYIAYLVVFMAGMKIYVVRHITKENSHA